MVKFKSHIMMRLLALIFCALFIAVLLLSNVYIIENENHIHDRDGANGCCSVCAQLETAENFLNQLGIALVSSTIIILGLLGSLLLKNAAKRIIAAISPIQLKVKLNN